MSEEAVEIPLRSQEDVVGVRQKVRAMAIQIGLNLVDQTKVVTAASELARNTVVHGGGGVATLAIVSSPKRGLRLSFEDEGPGIEDIGRALTDGYTSGSGLGLGLGGAKRLTNEFSIDSTPGKGTRVVVVKWKD